MSITLSIFRYCVWAVRSHHKNAVVPFYKLVCYFIWKEELWPAVHSFKRTVVFWRIRFSHPFFHLGWFILQDRCSHPLFQGLYGTDNLWQQLLIWTASYFFWKSYLRYSIFLRVIYLFYYSNYNLSSFEVRYLFLSHERVAVIHSLKDTVLILTGDLAFIHCLMSHSFSSSIFISKKSWFQLCILSEMLSLFLRNTRSHPFFQKNGTVYFYDIKICSYPLLLTNFFSVNFWTPVTVKQTSYQKRYIFRVASIILKWKQPLQAATFSQKYFVKLSGAATNW